MVAALRQKLENGDPFDVSFAFTLYDRMLAEKAAQIEALAARNRLLEERLQATTARAIEKSEESLQVARLLNGTVGVFNALAERLAGAIDRLCAVLASRQEGGDDERGG